MKNKDEKVNKSEKEMDQEAEKIVKGSVATWDESIHINRGKSSESDELQETVRHHRKDTKTDPHREVDKDKKTA